MDIDHIDQCRLSFFIGEHDCQITIFDEQKQKLLLFENYLIESSPIDFLNKIHDQHELVPAGFGLPYIFISGTTNFVWYQAFCLTKIRPTITSS